MAKLKSGTRIYGTATVDSKLIVNGGVNANSTTTGDVVVAGGLGVGQDLYVGGLIYGVVTSATNITGGVVTKIYAGTDTAINTTTGIVTVWNTSTLQSVTDRGSITNNPITISNTLTVANTVIANGYNLLNYDGNVWYVSDASHASNSNDGRRQISAFATVKHALSVAQSGDTVFVDPGTYTEIFPLTVPQGVSLRGAGLREVTIQPTTITKNNDALLLNGETFIGDLTLSGFFKPGYAFKFASGAKITTRSPYIERVSVITYGSTSTVADPYGYAAGDAGHGAYIDASVLDPTSLEPAMLWNEVTFIVPNATGMYMTNGARAELLNGFFYFANKAIDAQYGASGYGGVGKTRIRLGGVSGTFTVGDTLVYKSSTGTTLATGVISSATSDYVYISGPSWGFQTAEDASTSTQNVYSTGLNPATATSILLADYHQFGAELRCIGSAACFGNKGVIANGTGTDLKLIAFNFSHIGSLGDLTDDASLTVQANEVTQTNGGKIFFQTVDQSGDFRVGNYFYVNQRTGNIIFGSAGGTLTTNTNQLIITDGVNNSIITPTSIQTGYLSLSGNALSSTAGNINISPASSSTVVNGNLTVTGSANIGQTSYINGAEIVTTATLAANTGTQNFAGGINVSGTATIGGGLTVGGNLTVNGTVTYINSNEVDIGTKVINLATLTNTASFAAGAGIEIGPNGSTFAQWIYDGGTPGNWQSSGGIVSLSTGNNLGSVSVPWSTVYANSVISNSNNYSTSTVANNSIQLVNGGIGSKFLYLSNEGWIGDSKIVTVNTLSNYAVTSLTAGTDTVVTANIGLVTVYNNSTLQTVTSRGATTNQVITLTNGTNSFSTDTGALIVSGGVGVLRNMYVAGQIRLANATPSTDVNSGALIVTGGIGVGGTVTIGDQTTIYVNTTSTYPSVIPSLVLDNLGSNTSALQITNTAGKPILFTNYNGVLRLLINSFELLYGTGTALTVVPTTAASSTQTGALVVAGGVGVGGALYANQLYDSNSRVITVATLGTYGVSNITAGTDTAVSTSTGAVTIWNTSTLQTITSRGASSNNVITLTNTTNSTAPNNGALVVTYGVGIGQDLWVGGIINGALKSAIATITNLQVVGTTNSTSTNTGALTVTGGVGIGGNLYIGGNGYIGNDQIVTSATINTFANKTSVFAGTDTAVNTSTGNITVWNTSTLQSVTGRGATTTNAVYVQNNIFGNAVYDNNNRVVTGVVPSGSTYIGVGSVVSTGTQSSFTIFNLGVQSVTAGDDISVSASTGTVTINGTATLQTVTARGAVTNQAITITSATNSTATTNGALVVTGGIGVGGNGYFGGNLYANGLQVLTSATVNQFSNQTVIYAGTDTAVSANTGTIYIWNTSTLQTVTGRGATTTNAVYVQNNIYGNAVYDNNNRVVTSVVPSGSTYIGIGSLISAGTQSSFTIHNLGVQTITAGTDTVVTASTGTITVYGNATLQSVTGRGSTTNQAVTITNVTASTTTVAANSLYVAGGVGIGSSLYVTGPAVFSNNVIFNGTTTYVFSTNTVYTDNILELHYPTGNGNTWSVNDGKDVGLRFHYYDTQDQNGFLGRDNGTGYLDWISAGVEDNTSTVSGTYGIFRTGGIILTNTTASSSTQTGALTVVGGVGVGGNLYVGGTIFGTISGSITTATNLAGGAAGQIPYQSGVGQTTFSSNLTYSSGTLTVANTTPSSSTQTGAVVVGGGVGIGGALYVNTTSFVAGAQILTTATVNEYANQTFIFAGTDTAVNTSTGNVTIWNISTLQTITNRGATTTNAVYVQNNLYGNAVYDNNNRVVTSVVPSGSTYINIGSLVSTGTQTSFAIFNTGVTTVNGSTYIGVNANTGSVTITNLGVQQVVAGTDITVSANTGSVTVNDASTLQTVSGRGATTTNAISIINQTASLSTGSGALTVSGGVGIGGALYVGTTSFVFGNEIITTATINIYATKTVITAGTDTAVNTSTGNITIWNTGTLQTITNRGATTTNAINITNTSPASSTTTGALIVSGGIGAADIYGVRLFDGNNRVVTTVTPTGGTAIGIASLTSSGPSASFTINNLGVTSAVAGTGITVSASTGAVTISNSGVLSVNGSTYIGVSNTTGNVTLTNLGVQTITAGTDTVVTASTGSVVVYNNSTLQTITNRGASTTNQVSLNNGVNLGSTANTPLNFNGTYSNPNGLFIDVSGATSTPSNSTAYWLNGSYTLTPSVAVTQYYGVNLIPVLNNNTAYTNMYGHYSRIDLGASAAGSISNWYGYVSGNPSKNAGATTTFNNHVGFRAEDPSNITSNNVSGFQSNISAGSGRYNFYAGGSAINYFGGNVGINQSSPIYPLDITGGARLTGILTITNVTTASSTLTGAIQVAGGVGIRGDLWVGGTINGLIAGATSSATSVLITNDTTSSAVHFVTFVSTTGSYAQIKTDGPTGLTYIPQTGFHGIGTGTPIAALDVSGGVRITGITTVTNNLYANALYDNSNRVVTSVTPTGGTAIGIASLASGGTAASFTINNLGVTALAAGTDTVVTASTGSVTVYNNSTLQTITNRGATTNNAVSITNSSVSASTSTGQALLVSGGIGSGPHYASQLFDSGNRVVTSVVPSGSTYIGVGGVVSAGTQSSFTIFNLGVQQVVAGTDITVSANTGSVTVNDASTLQTVSGRGATTNNAISITNSTAASSTQTGALIVTGGVGIGGALFVNTTSYVFGNEIITTATVNLYATKTVITAGTDTAINTSTGNITIWNTSTLQSITTRGATTTNAIYVQNNIYGNAVYDNSNRVVTSVTPTGGTAIGISGLTSTGPASSFTINNLGVTALTAGTDTVVTASTGSVTVYNNSTLQSITNRGATTNNAVTITNATASTSTTTGALIVSGGVGIGGDLNVNGTITAAQLTIQYTTVTTTFVKTDDIISTYNTTNATSTNTGALQVGGGVGIGRDLVVGGNISSNGSVSAGTYLFTQGSGTGGSNAGLILDYSGNVQWQLYPVTTSGRLALTSGGSEWLSVLKTGYVGIGTTNPSYTLQVNGSFAATTKSFVIDHPTRPTHWLRYGSLEGPENGVYVRGRLKDNFVIELPEYWTKLVDPESITVTLTPVGRHQKLYVDKIEDNCVFIGNDNLFGKAIDCFYTVWGERADVEKLVAELPK